MAGTPYLIDTNIMLRWVKPDDTDYPIIVSAIDSILRQKAVLCYTSQNLAEFWTPVARSTATDSGSVPKRPTDAQGFLKGGSSFYRTTWPSITSGANCSSCTMSRESKFMMRGWSRR